MTENQKLREAFSRIRSLITDTTRIDSHTISLVRVECDQALALPTAEQVGDINVAESFTSVTKTAPPLSHKPGCPADGGYGNGPEPCICGAAPVVERELFERTMMDKFGWERKDFKTDERDVYMDGYTVTAWMTWQARAALEA